MSKSFWDGDASHLFRGISLGREAVSLDPNEPLGHAALGFALMHSRQYKDARTCFDEALSLNPNDTSIRGLRAILNCYTGRNEEALGDIEEALRRDPYAADWLWDERGMIMMACGRPADAIASYEKMKYVPPWGLAFQAVSYIELGKPREAGAIYRRLCDEFSDWNGGKWKSNLSYFFGEFESQTDIDRFTEVLGRAKAAA